MKSTRDYSSTRSLSSLIFFFFNDTATTEIYTLSLHDALPIYTFCGCAPETAARERSWRKSRHRQKGRKGRSEEHTSELQSRPHLVCRLLLEKKKKITTDGMDAISPSISMDDLTLGVIW